MKNDPLPLSETPDGVLLKVHVQPRASRTGIQGWTEEGLKVRLTSPPVDGAANRLCTDYLAKILGVSRSAVAIEAGEKSRHKLVSVRGISSAEAADKIAKAEIRK